MSQNSIKCPFFGPKHQKSLGWRLKPSAEAIIGPSYSILLWSSCVPCADILQSVDYFQIMSVFKWITHPQTKLTEIPRSNFYQTLCLVSHCWNCSSCYGYSLYLFESKVSLEMDISHLSISPGLTPGAHKPGIAKNRNFLLFENIFFAV